MPKHSSKPEKPKLPTDVNQRGKAIVDFLTRDQDEPQETAAPAVPASLPEPEPPQREKDPAAVSLGRRGGLKGGKARAANLTPEQRSEIAKKAAEARWKPRE